MAEPLLVVEGLSGYYGTAHVLQEVSFTMGVEPVAVIGRNGMGKTTLCKTIVGLLGATGRSDGSVRLAGEELHGKPAYKIAKAGVGYVPQGRRLFTSLTVDEHLQIVGAPSKAAWTPDRPALVEPALLQQLELDQLRDEAGDRGLVEPGTRGDRRARARAALGDVPEHDTEVVPAHGALIRQTWAPVHPLTLPAERLTRRRAAAPHRDSGAARRGRRRAPRRSSPSRSPQRPSRAGARRARWPRPGSARRRAGPCRPRRGP